MIVEKIEAFSIALEESARLRPILRNQRAPVAIPGHRGAWWLRRMVTTGASNGGRAVVLYAVRAQCMVGVLATPFLSLLSEPCLSDTAVVFLG